MYHVMIDGFRGFRSRFDDIKLVQESLEEIPAKLGLQPVMPGFMLPYYDGVVPEDCGVSSFVSATLFSRWAASAKSRLSPPRIR